MLKCRGVRVDVIVDMSWECSASFDFDDNGECDNVCEFDIDTPSINVLLFNDKRDVGYFGVDGTGENTKESTVIRLKQTFENKGNEGYTCVRRNNFLCIFLRIFSDNSVIPIDSFVQSLCASNSKAFGDRFNECENLNRRYGQR